MRPEGYLIMAPKNQRIEESGTRYEDVQQHAYALLVKYSLYIDKQKHGDAPSTRKNVP